MSTSTENVLREQRSSEPEPTSEMLHSTSDNSATSSHPEREEWTSFWASLSSGLGAADGESLDIPDLDRYVYETDEEFVDKARHCVLKAVLERHIWIIHYLFESSKDLGEKVVLDEVLVDETRLRFVYTWNRIRGKRMNAITFCGRCAIGHVQKLVEKDLDEEEDDPFAFLGKMPEEEPPTEEEMEREYYQFLYLLLLWAERNQFLARVRKTITNEGLTWTGAQYAKLWCSAELREGLRVVFNFFIDRSNEFSEVLKGLITGEQNDALENLSLYSCDLYVKLLGVLLDRESLEAMLFPPNDKRRFWSIRFAWYKVLRKGSLGAVKCLWFFLAEKLKSEDRVKRFLLRKDGEKCNSLFVASRNRRDHDVLPFVWERHGNNFGAQERLEMMFDSFSGVDCGGHVNLNAFFALLYKLLESGLLDAQAATRLLLSRNEFGSSYLLELDKHLFCFPTSACAVFRLQALLRDFGLGTETILSKLKGVYEGIARSCFSTTQWTESDASYLRDTISSAFEEMKSCFPQDLWMDSSLLEDEVLEGYACYEGNKETRISALQIKTFYVFMRAQVELEQGCLGSDGVVYKLTKHWGQMLYPFHLHFQGWRTTVREKHTTTHFYRHFMNALSIFLTKEHLLRVLLSSSFSRATVFHYALSEEHPNGFLSLYDISRWVLGEDALWRIPCLPLNAEHGTILLYALLARQEKGFFDEPKEAEPEK